ncbi:MAG: peptide chain release factor 3 [Vampirovibrionales bacterium]|nr:peptide chain release factor 3 [Vampirovibrionales bacterium]
MSITEQVQKRRTFAIISHPDAGKTTLTEKLLLYGGAIHLAGSVTAKKAQRQATSDWMELEKQRGISITSTVLNFDYKDYRVNLLDTPGHQDFSEDTYRTLTAADSVVMLIDNAKGVETQTKKLFQVSKRRGIPVVTFINKMDRPGREPLELLDEIEQLFGIKTYPFNWPIGMGDTFKGVYDRLEKKVALFERTDHGKFKAPMSVSDIHDPALKAQLPPDVYQQAVEEIEILDMAGDDFSLAAYLAGEQTPVFFGSAANNFGIELFLDHYLKLAPSPSPRRLAGGESEKAPDDKDFTGFVFKIQANMDPNHRDRIAFIRVCSGMFKRDMQVKHPRSGKQIRLSHSHRLFGQEREIVDEAYAGDVIGLSSAGNFAIGDTLCEGQTLEFEPIPTFTPEQFALLKNPNPSKYKQFQKGVDQLMDEGAIQVMYFSDGAQRYPVMAAVGALQFEVVQHRMQSEYGVETSVERLPEYTHARWLGGSAEQVAAMEWIVNARKAEDAQGRAVALVKGEWALNYLIEKNPDIVFSDIPI